MKENRKNVIVAFNKVITTISYILFIILLPIIEIILYYFLSTCVHIIIISFSTSQVVLSIYSGIRTFYDRTISGKFCDPKKGTPECNCKINTGLLSGFHSTISLSFWISENLMISWIEAKNLMWYEHLLCYLPIIFYIFGSIIGYTIAYVKLNEPTNEEIAKLIPPKETSIEISVPLIPSDPSE
jgi:hypothetical protein